MTDKSTSDLVAESRLRRERSQTTRYGEAVRAMVLGRNKSHDRVYFICGVFPGPIKIGWAACVARRVSELQPGNPHPLTVLGTIPGGLKLEREIHKQFPHLRLYGEWFDPDQELLGYIRTHCRDCAKEVLS